jgi:hypothetical protein
MRLYPHRVIGLTGTHPLAYVLFIGLHVAALTLFYFHIALMGWTLALARVSP